jgi:kynurenine formamidase
MGLAGFALSTSGCATQGSAHVHEETPHERDARPQRCAAPRFRAIDLSHPLHPGVPVWPGGVPFKMERLSDYDQGYRFHRFDMGENNGTHVDAPSHFVADKRSVAQIPLDELVVPLAVLHVAKKAAKDPDYAILGDDIVDWESANGPVPVGCLFVADTGWHKRFRDPPAYLNQDAEGVMHFPGFSPEAAKLLVERDVVGIGIDTMSLDPGVAKDFPTHKVMLAANKYQIENLANLDKLPDLGATVVVGVVPVVDGSQAPARILALVPEQEEKEGEGEEEP